MSYVAELSLAHPELGLSHTLRTHADLPVRIESRPIPDGSVPTLFLSVESGEIESVERALADDRTVEDWAVVTDLEECCLCQIRLDTSADILTTMDELGIHVLDVHSGSGGWNFKVYCSSKEAIDTFSTRCEREDIAFQLENIHSVRSKTDISGCSQTGPQLTSRQLDVAKAAAEMGYFDHDGATAAEVASHLDIAPSTLSTHLRAVISKVFDELFIDD